MARLRPFLTELFQRAAFEDGSYTVVRTDPAKPRFMEVVATFYEAAKAQDYADMANGEKSKPLAEVAAPALPPEKENAKPNGATPEPSARQAAVLDALLTAASRLGSSTGSFPASQGSKPCGAIMTGMRVCKSRRPSQASVVRMAQESMPSFHCSQSPAKVKGRSLAVAPFQALPRCAIQRSLSRDQTAARLRGATEQGLRGRRLDPRIDGLIADFRSFAHIGTRPHRIVL